MKKTILLFVIFIIASVILKAQSPDLANKVDSIINASFSATTPGCAVGVIKDGKVLYKRTYGMSNLDYRIPVSDSTLFNLASVSKQFTAFLVLLLEKEGKLNLDDQVEKYIPELKIYGPAITIRQMLHHTSGIPSTDNILLFAGLSAEMPWNTEDEFNMIQTYQKLNYKPNTEENYSNAGYYLLSRIIEKVTGESFSKCMSEKIFKPLNMKTATIYDSQGKIIINRATGYRKTGDIYIKTNTEGESIPGSTNLYTSVNDMTNWCINLTTYSLGGKEISDKQFNTKDTLNNGDTIHYTYGFFVWKRRGLKTVEHGGFTMGFKDQVTVMPEKGLAVFVMSNNENIDPGNIETKIVDLYLKDQLKPEIKKDHKQIEINKDMYKLYMGNYLMDDGMILKFTDVNDTLKLVIPGAPEFVMYPEKENEFFLKDFDAQCTFTMNKEGKVNEIVWHQNNVNPKGIRYTEPKPLTQKELQEFVGKYEIPELNVIYPITLAENELIVTLPKTFRSVGFDTKMKIEHVSGDIFHGSLGKIIFRRNNEGKISGFVIADVGRIRNIEFTKRD
jgi:CubicO group peptidase (beta-lactamase class C family)